MRWTREAASTRSSATSPSRPTTSLVFRLVSSVIHRASSSDAHCRRSRSDRRCVTDALHRLAVALAACTMLAACVRGSLPPREFYRLPSPGPAEAPREGASGPGLLAGSLTIIPYDTPGIYAGPGILYRIDAAEYGVYPSREWAIPLSDMLAAATERMLQAMPLTSEPATIGSPRR